MKKMDPEYSQTEFHMKSTALL